MLVARMQEVQWVEIASLLFYWSEDVTVIYMLSLFGFAVVWHLLSIIKLSPILLYLERQAPLSPAVEGSKMRVSLELYQLTLLNWS
jgi:hypothetical protein